MKKLGSTISLWFGIVMVLMVAAGAVVFAFTDFMSDTLNGNRRVLLIVIFVAYAIFRGIRIYQVLTTSDDEA